ncbi:MAG: hypothetical protein JXB14_06100 [Candidatus Altiarchaeota archaeon]|nr:hypothetical protein [Candidatus Altiarchaeota archaeon]
MERGRRGQVAIENLFIIILIVMAVSIIVGGLISNKESLGVMYDARVQAQEIAYNLTVKEGITTHVIRLDDTDIDGKIPLGEIRVYIVAEDCDEVEPKFKKYFNDYFAPDITLDDSAGWCEELYTLD